MLILKGDAVHTFDDRYRMPQTARANSSAVAGSYDAIYAAAVTSYRAYLEQQSTQLAQSAGKLRDAIAAGNVQTARTAYADARTPYLRIMAPAKYLPVSNQIDAQFLYIPIDASSGMHRIEQGLWQGGSTAGLLDTANQLVTDTTALHDQMATMQMDALRMTDTYAILDAHPIITNYEPEPFSHLGLIDHEAQVEGSRFVFDQLRPAITLAAPQLADQIADLFTQTDAALAAVRTPDGFLLDTEIGATQKRQLDQAFHALGSELNLIESLLLGTAKQTSGCFGGNTLATCQHGS